MKKLVAPALIALLLGACSDSGGSDDTVAQPADDFIDSVEAVCRDASDEIVRLEPGDDSPAELRDIVSDAADSLGDLDAPDDLGAPNDRIDENFDEYREHVGAMVAALDELVEGVETDDSGRVESAIQTLNAASNEGDLAVNMLGAIRCRGLVPPNGLVPADLVIDTTAPTVTESTPLETDPPPTDAPTTTAPPNTPLSIDTLPSVPPTEETPPPPTTVEEEIFPTDLSLFAAAPPGFTWVPYDPPDAGGLYRNSVIGDLVLSYDAGELQSATDSTLTANVFLVRLSEPFTPEYVEAYQFWEAVDEGTDTTTPGGIPVRLQTEAFDNVDCGVATFTTTGIALCVFTGGDVLGLIDQFVAANPQ